jgi:O-antigen/teichoic acid export membrane protein
MKNNTLKSMSWYSFDILFNRGAFFFVTLYIAKIIGPAEFGLASILGVIYYLGLAVSDSGMSNSLMRTKECDDADYGTVLMTNLIFGLFIYLLLLFLTPIISEFYNSPKLLSLLPVYGFGILLSSFKSVYIAFMMKNFEYKRMFLLNIPGNIFSIILAIILSKYGYGVWSIIALFLSNQLISLILFYLFSGWKTVFVLNKSKFKFHFNFGYKLSISAFINTIFENIYQLIIGKYFSIRMTGIYDRAFTLGNYPISILSTVLSKVTLPLFVNYANDIVLFKEKFRETIKLISFVTCFVTGVILIIVPFMIKHYMGVQWMESIKIFEILCLGLLFNPIHSMNLNILNVYGRSDIFLMLEVIKKGVQVVSIIVCYQFGIVGLVIGFVGLSVFSLLVNLYYTQYFLKYSVFNQLLDIMPNILAGFLCFLISKYILNGQIMNVYLLGIQVIIFVSLFYFLSFFSNKLSFYYVKKVVSSIIQKIYNSKLI